MSNLFLIFLSFGLFNYANGYNFLIISPVYGFSHMKCMAAIANQLADAGHQVTYFQPFVVELYQKHDLIKNPSIEVIDYWHDEEGKKNIQSSEVLSDAWTSVKYQSDIGVKIFAPRILHGAFQHMCRRIFEDKELHKMLKDKKFDVVLSETFDFCGLYLADYLEMPAIISVFTGSKLSAITDALGEPSFLHYYPSPSSNFGPKQTLYDRMNNFWYKTLSTSAFGELFDRQFADIDKIMNGTVRHWKQILGDVTYHFANSNPYLDFVVPTIPKVVPIGGYTMDYTQVPPVSKELDEILNKRKYTVFISYGTMVSAKFMPDDYKKAMIQFFKHNKNVTFLWKYEEPEEEFMKKNIPENVYLSKWFPQPSLLADKRVNMFITHGGLGSTMELAYAAKPGIVTPLFADQPSNAQMLSRHKSVEVFSKHDIPNWKKQSDLLRKVLTDESYQIAATRLAELLNHQPINPRDLVVKYSENAARFGKIPSLTPFAKDMGFVEYYNIDLIIYAFSFLLFAIYGAIETFGFIGRCFGSKQIKVE
uniref:glucuronosyltransferase n=1 Tax=Caenorhabditis tropicalis TaxID=1561998 RepID=A0A1I7SZ16_9PELO